MPVTKVTRNYQITIPKEIREKLGINVGDVLIFDIEGGKIVLRKEKLELPVLKGGKNLTVEKIEESIRKGMRED
jgi:AbrB family looped-hinge helix DNA binding protein